MTRSALSLTLVTAPAIEPLTIAEVSRHLRYGDTNLEPVPAAPTVALVSPAAPGNVDNGDHRYRVTFVTADGETDGGVISGIVTVADKAVNGKVLVSAIPLGGSAVTARKLYRTTAGGTAYFLLATVADNTTTTYTDNIADASLGAGAPAVNTTADPHLTGLIKTARHWTEEYLRRSLIEQTHDWSLDAFPVEFAVPRPPLISVTSVTYVDTAGASQTLSASIYRVDTAAEPGRITPAYGEAWPSVREVTNAVIVRFKAGYGTAASAVPEPIRQAMLLLIGEMHERREQALVGTSIVSVPFGVKELLSPYRAMGF